MEYGSNDEVKSVTPVIVDCQVTFDEIPVTQLVEYKFPEEDFWYTITTKKFGFLKNFMSQFVL